MPDRRSTEVGFNVRVGREVDAVTPLPEVPFRIIVLGDFSGRANREPRERGPDLAERPVVQVDRDNLNEVLGWLAPELQIATGDRTAQPVTLRIREIDDFHPDRLFEQLPLFSPLRDLRRRLADPATAEETARALGGGDAPPSERERATPPEDAAVVLERILAETSGGQAEASQVLGGELRSVLKRVVSPHLVPEAGPLADAMLSRVDSATNSLMRWLLHDPEVQRLEALWRAVDFLTRRLETSSSLQVHLLDVSKQQVAADQAASVPLERSGLYRLLVDSAIGTPGGIPWALIVASYFFGPGAEDLLLLARLGALGSLAGAPVIAGGAPQLAGCQASFHDTPDPADWSSDTGPLWDALRREPQAAYLGLALPRFLLRLPYGEDSEPCDSFPFEELPEDADHEDYLWGNAAFVGSLLLGQRFAAAGWALRLAGNLEVGGLPLHVIRSKREASIKPCAENLLSERAAARLLELGLMPLVSVKDRDVVRLLECRSVAYPPRGIAGLWGRIAD